MFRGFLSGLIMGSLLVALVVGLASLMAPLPATVKPQTETASGTTGTTEQDSTAPESGSQADDGVATGESPPVAEPAPEVDPAADTASAPKPETGGGEDSLQTPDTGESSGMSVESDSPVDPDVQTTAPEAPSAEEEPSITTNPAQPSSPSVPEGGAFEDSGDRGDNGDTGDSAESGDSGDVTPEAEEGAPPAGDEDESLLKPAGSLDEKFPQRESSRLPTVGGATGTEETSAAVPEAGPEADSPFVINAEDLTNADGKPLMSIVLIDDGSALIDRQALAEFPFPVSFAVNTLATDAAERAGIYRELNSEVLAMIDIPAEAAPADVEQAMAAHLAVLPQAVGVMEGTGPGLQGSKGVSDQVTQVLRASGHGLLLFPQGFDTARKLAAKEGVPAATVFRDFDGKGQTASVMRRFLDQAAFKASQEGGVIMVGRLQPDTVSALLLWGLQDRVGTVALAPVSAVIRAKTP